MLKICENADESKERLQLEIFEIIFVYFSQLLSLKEITGTPYYTWRLDLSLFFIRFKWLSRFDLLTEIWDLRVVNKTFMKMI